MVLSRFRGGELRISPPTASLPVRYLLPVPVPRLIRIISGVKCARRMRPPSSAPTAISSFAKIARKCTSRSRRWPITSSLLSMRPCREDPRHLPPGFFTAGSILNMRSILTARLTRLRCVPSVSWIHKGHDFHALSTLSQGFKDTISTLVNTVRFQFVSFFCHQNKTLLY